MKLIYLELKSLLRQMKSAHLYNEVNICISIIFCLIFSVVYDFSVNFFVTIDVKKYFMTFYILIVIYFILCEIDLIRRISIEQTENFKVYYNYKKLVKVKILRVIYQRYADFIYFSVAMIISFIIVTKDIDLVIYLMSSLIIYILLLTICFYLIYRKINGKIVKIIASIYIIIVAVLMYKFNISYRSFIFSTFIIATVFNCVMYFFNGGISDESFVE